MIIEGPLPSPSAASGIQDRPSKHFSLKKLWLRKRPPSNPWPFLTVKEESRADAQDKAPQQYRAALLKRLSDEKTAPMRMDGAGGLLELLADIQRSHAELLDCAGCENCKDGDTGARSTGCRSPERSRRSAKFGRQSRRR
mgnify:CR=1 FL=1